MIPSQTIRSGRRDALKEVALLFLKLGVVAFGGPAAHIAMMEDEVVSRRKWMTREHFLDLVGATNLIPGPNSTEMAIHCGFQRAGWPGLIVAGACFIFPAVLLTGFLAYAYARYGQLPQVEPFVYGIRPAVLAVIAGAVLKLGKKALKGWELGVVGAGVMACVVGGANEVVAIFAGGLIGMIWLHRKRSSGRKGRLHLPTLLPVPISFPATTALVSAVVPLTSSQLFLSFLKIGAILFGSGYVLVAYLQGELVDRLGWLTHRQLLDAVAIGQFTPGPVLSTSTFIGYQLQGIRGAVLATLGIFLPSFLFVAVLNPLIPRLRRSPWTAQFLDAVNISAVGIMAAVLVTLSASSVTDWKTAVIAIASLALVAGYKRMNAVGIVLGGSLLGYILHRI